MPLVTHYTYNVYRVLPCPVRVDENSNKFTFIQPDRELLASDTTKQHYVKINKEEAMHCKLIRACRQDFPLQISQTSSDC
jgi:hypothetical protein